MKMRLPAMAGTGQVEVTARYRREDPYALHLHFGLRPGVDWAISRELVADALVSGQAGIGDVRVTARGDLVVLALSTPSGSGTAVFRRDDMAELIGRTHELVRPGTESEVLDWSDLAEFPGVSQ
jgi:hypothetical protein